MTFEQLEYFLAAARAETFFDAAESLHITQSALSKHIMKLEKELNVRLFDRSRRSAVLTDAGREFLKEAGDLFHRYRAMRKRMQAFEDVSERTLRIGTLPFLSQYGLTGLFKDFSAAHPEIRLLLEEVEEIDLLSGFSSGRYDLITWVPLSEQRRKARGYDQAMLLAEAAALELGDVAAETLAKVRDTSAQSGLGKDDSARRANVLGAYRPTDPELIDGQRILLMDDVVTTGSALSECARTLRTAGAADVVCVTLARARK